VSDKVGMIEKLQELAARLDSYKLKIDRMKANGMFTEKAVNELRKKAYNEIVSEKEALIDGEPITQELIDSYVAEFRSRNVSKADDLFRHAYEVKRVADPWTKDKDYGLIETQKKNLEGIKEQKDLLVISDGSELKAFEVAGLASGLTSDAFNSISRNIRAELSVPITE